MRRDPTAVQPGGGMRLRRRAFMTRAAGCGLLISLPGLAACKRDTPAADGAGNGVVATAEVAKAPPAPVWKFYTADEGRTLSAMVERLLPGGGQTGLPSAQDAGVAAYVDQQLSLPTFSGLSRMMRAGVQFVDRAARRDHSGGFHTLPAAKQDATLTAFQSGRVGGMRFPQAAFFDQLLRFSLEGYLGAPEHGGNRDAVAWKALGIDPRCHNMYERCG